MPTILPDDYDAPWKEALETYFTAFIAFFLPQAYAEIDWSRGYTFLDKELHQVVREAAQGRRLVDKLARVWRTGGAETWVLIHIEVQSREETAFAERMALYYHRLRDRYRRPVASLAVLGDERATWKPQYLEETLWGCMHTFRFPVVKLLDYRDRWAELEADENPFAVVIMAHLSTQETRHDAVQRKDAKLRIVRGLYERGYTKDAIIKLHRFIDWLMWLPDDIRDVYWQELQEYEQEKQMPYITSIEQIGIEKGLQQGLQQGRREELLAGIELALELKFGGAGLALMPDLRLIADLDVLRAVRDQIKAAETPEALRQIYRPQ